MMRPTGPWWALGAWRSLIAAVLATAIFFGLGDMTPAEADPAASTWFETEQGRVRLIAAAARIGAADLIQRYAREVPGDGTASGIALTASRILPGKSPTLELSLASEAPLIAPDAFVEGAAGLAFGAPRVQRAADGRSAILDIPVSE